MATIVGLGGSGVKLVQNGVGDTTCAIEAIDTTTVTLTTAVDKAKSIAWCDQVGCISGGLSGAPAPLGGGVVAHAYLDSSTAVSIRVINPSSTIRDTNLRIYFNWWVVESY